MEFFRQEALLPIIQLAITPVIFIAGLGSLLLTMTNRMGRIVDRTRIMAGQLRTAGPADRAHVESQLRILFRRAKIIRVGVTFNALSMFCAGLLVVVLFLGALLQAEMAIVIVSLFSLTVLCFISALSAFLRDIFISLTALELEVDRALAAPKAG